MIDKQDKERMLRRSNYYKQSTVELLNQKSQELGMSMNKTTEICLKRFLPEMSSTNSWS